MAFQQTPSEPGDARHGDSGIVPLRIERGSEVFFTDGVLGTVEQVVMDQQTHELRAIVVRPLGATQELLIGIGHVARAGDNQVHLDFSRRAMAADPRLAQPYNPARFVAVPPDAAVPSQQAARIASAADLPVVTQLEPDAVELMAPAHEVEPSQSPPSERLTADWHTPGNIASVRPERMEPSETAAALAEAREDQQGTPRPSRNAAAPSTAAELRSPREPSPTTPSMTPSMTRKATRSTQEKAPMPKSSDRSLRTPQAKSTQQEAQQVASTPDNVAPLTEEGALTEQPSGRPAWLTPAVIGAGALALAGGVAFGVLLYQRRSQPTRLDWWRAQVRQLSRDPQRAAKTITKDVRKTVQGTIQGALPELTTIGALATDQVDAWRGMLGDQVNAWSGTVGEQAMSNLKQVSKISSKNLSMGLAGWLAGLASLAALTSDQLDDWRFALNNQLDDWRSTVGSTLSSNSTAFSKSLGKSAKSVTRGPRRVVRRGMVGMRWFRRGIALGALGGAVIGLLAAPMPGSQLRTKIFDSAKQLSSRVQNAMTTAQTRQGQISGQTPGTTTTTGGALSGTTPIR